MTQQDSQPSRPANAHSVEAGLARPGGITYLHIPAADVRQAAAFYRDIFGWKVDGADSDRTGCILTRQAAIPVLNALLVVPATRTVRDIPTEVKLGLDDGMPADCALSLDNLLPVPKSLMTERITRLSPTRMAELCAALGRATAR